MTGCTVSRYEQFETISETIEQFVNQQFTSKSGPAPFPCWARSFMLHERWILHMILNNIQSKRSIDRWPRHESVFEPGIEKGETHVSPS